MTSPILRATSETGDVIDDPSEDALFMMLSDLEDGQGSFLIVDSLLDPDQLTYAQTSRNDDGTYIVEYRAGGPETHLGTVVPDMRAAHAVLTGWAFDLPGWRDTYIWQPVE